MTERVFTPPGEMATTWLIARRAAIEALRDRLTLISSVFFAAVLPIGVLFMAVRPLVEGDVSETSLTSTLATLVLVVGLSPALAAMGIASGQFAGEKERGLLTPLLASPASNLAIFAGKVVGSVIPPLAYSLVAQAVFVFGLAVMLGPGRLLQLPTWLGVAIVMLVISVTCFAAIVASLISSRVRTFNTAQQVTGLVLTPVWGGLFALTFLLRQLGPLALFSCVAAFVVLDVCLTIAAAATWRREEVLSHT
jgi:ABC-type Na+ efflux pump permease subunit